MSLQFARFEEDQPDIPLELLLARDRGEVLFVAGAGVSQGQPANLPSFRGLVREVYDELDNTLAQRLHRLDEPEIRARRDGWRNLIEDLDPWQQAELKRFDDGDFDVALGMLERRLDTEPDRGSSVRRKVTRILERANSPTRYHHALVRLGQRFGQVLLATTNFDLLFEAAAKKQRKTFTVQALGGMLHPSRRKEFAGIMHLHGVLGDGKNPASNLILTDQDFGEAYLRRRWAADFVYDAARIFRIVLVGYSVGDAPMRYLLNAISGDELRFPDLKPRYAFVPVMGDDPRLLADWRARGIIPIPYNAENGHAALEQTLSSWAESAPEPGTDQWAIERAKSIAAKPRSEASEHEKSLFAYLIERASLTDRMRVVEAISAANAGPDWLDEINRMLRGEGAAR